MPRMTLYPSSCAGHAGWGGHSRRARCAACGLFAVSLLSSCWKVLARRQAKGGHDPCWRCGHHDQPPVQHSPGPQPCSPGQLLCFTHPRLLSVMTRIMYSGHSLQSWPQRSCQADMLRGAVSVLGAVQPNDLPGPHQEPAGGRHSLVLLPLRPGQAQQPQLVGHAASVPCTASLAQPAVHGLSCQCITAQSPGHARSCSHLQLRVLCSPQAHGRQRASRMCCMS